MDKYHAINQLVFFLYNFPDYHEVFDWISKHENVCGKDHLIYKWKGYCESYGNPEEAWLRFYLDCDAEIRRALIDYCTTVYPLQKSI